MRAITDIFIKRPVLALVDEILSYTRKATAHADQQDRAQQDAAFLRDLMAATNRSSHAAMVIVMIASDIDQVAMGDFGERIRGGRARSDEPCRVGGFVQAFQDELPQLAHQHGQVLGAHDDQRRNGDDQELRGADFGKHVPRLNRSAGPHQAAGAEYQQRRGDQLRALSCSSFGRGFAGSSGFSSPFRPSRNAVARCAAPAIGRQIQKPRPKCVASSAKV